MMNVEVDSDKRRSGAKSFLPSAQPIQDAQAQAPQAAPQGLQAATFAQLAAMQHQLAALTATMQAQVAGAAAMPPPSPPQTAH
jgi:hypothetical protein